MENEEEKELLPITDEESSVPPAIAQMLQQEDIDAVYIATTHNFHYDNAMLCLAYNKHLLIEKPMTINAAESEAIFAEAAKRKLFVMEAMWTRFLPAVIELQEIIADGVIGELVMVNADFGFKSRSR